jgi:hypothetical protein
VSGTRCRDCGWECLSAVPGEVTEYFMVRDKTWRKARMKRGCLCVGCLEARLGRKLKAADFIDVPMNDLSIANVDYAWSWRTDRLINRMTRKKKDPRMRR